MLSLRRKPGFAAFVALSLLIGGTVAIGRLAPAQAGSLNCSFSSSSSFC
jgi:hypothetical protein